MRTIGLNIALAGLALSGCAAVGPDYAGPSTPAPLAASGARFVNAEEAPNTPLLGSWWRGFGDPELDRLMNGALAANRTISAAEARLDQARAVLRSRRGELGPSGEARASYARTRPAIAAFGVAVPGVDAQDIDLVDIGYLASWELDLFGGRRRAVEAARAQVGAADASVDDVRLVVLGETAAAYVSLRDAEARLVLNGEDEALQQRLRDLVAERRRLGVASDLDVERVDSRRVATQAERPGIVADIEAARTRLALLTGRELAALSIASEGTSMPVPPPGLVVGDPAGLLRRRPDVRAAERRVAEASAEIGVATADLFPKVSLLGNIGVQADGVGNIGSDSFTYSIGPLLSWSFPDLGRVRARIAQREGRLAELLADYEQTVLSTLADAEAALARYRRARQEVEARERALGHADRSAALARTAYLGGAATLLEVLEAERERVDTRRSLSEAQAQAARTYAVLSTALGLGWDTAADGGPPVS